MELFLNSVIHRYQRQFFLSTNFVVLPILMVVDSMQPLKNRRVDVVDSSKALVEVSSLFQVGNVQCQERKHEAIFSKLDRTKVELGTKRASEYIESFEKMKFGQVRILTFNIVTNIDVTRQQLKIIRYNSIGILRWKEF